MPVWSADEQHFEASAGCGGATTSPTADPPHGLSGGTVLFETLPALDLQLGL